MSQIEVSVHPATRERFFLEIFTKYPTLESAILADFKRYKSEDILPDYFGRDVAYTEPYAAFRSGLMHIHLCFPPDSFPSNRPQPDRVCKRGSPENDASLVYVQGELYENRYSLIAIMHPDAHGKARQHEVMNYPTRIAQEFRDNN
ncbi:type II toxin-antitoxin system YafO family toxin [Candidatus Pantoea multigeneris]|uniref:mRNA interferase YafO n=1 Tax=Candidatus Pantoea multigeneris TaxID=2608357 RepID=A0ABX0REC5_9GAMM|nr:type II toxin-antitoxin system YafO family toxin [Pantoea multigeneris]NIF23708.1 hypothetical protein [Pantoea multigeneris]